MLPPIDHVRALAVENIAERGVSVVARPAEHGVVAADFAGKKHPVAVIWQKRVLHLMEHPKILGPGHPNGGQIFIAVAPGDVIPILQLADPGIVGVFKREIRRSVDKADGPGLNVPVDAVLGETDVQPRHPAGVVATEHPGESAPEGNGGAVENAIGIGQGVPFDDGVSSIPPQG